MPSDTIRRVRWLVHPSLSSAVGDALVRHGNQVVALDEPTLAAAKAKQLDVITADDSLVDEALAKGYNRSVVYLAVERGDVEQDDAVDRLFKRYKRLGPGRLYTVSASRVKVRQLPTKIAAE